MSSPSSSVVFSLENFMDSQSELPDSEIDQQEALKNVDLPFSIQPRDVIAGHRETIELMNTENVSQDTNNPQDLAQSDFMKFEQSYADLNDNSMVDPSVLGVASEVEVESPFKPGNRNFNLGRTSIKKLETIKGNRK